MTSIRQTPRVTFSSLCEYLAVGDQRRLSLLKQQKHARATVFTSYNDALRLIQDHAVDGTSLSESGRRLEPHEREIIAELLGRQWVCPGARAARPGVQAPMVIQGVEVSVFPDLILYEGAEDTAASGALKFYFPKSRDLDPGVGRAMASVLYQYRLTIEGDASADPDLCMVYDVRHGQYMKAGKSHKRLFQNIDSACRFVAAIWPSL